MLLSKNIKSLRTLALATMFVIVDTKPTLLAGQTIFVKTPIYTKITIKVKS